MNARSLYIFLQHNSQQHIHRALQYKAEWNTDTWCCCMKWYEVMRASGFPFFLFFFLKSITGAFIFYYFFSLSPISAPLLSIDIFKASANFKKKEREREQTNKYCTTPYICNTRFRKKITTSSSSCLPQQDTWYIRTFIEQCSISGEFSLHNKHYHQQMANMSTFWYIFCVYIYI